MSSSYTTPLKASVRSGTKDNSPLSPSEEVEKTGSEKKHRSLQTDIKEQTVSVTVTQWNVKSAGLFVRSADHKALISIIHSTAGTNADIFCFQESLWVPRMFNKHIITANNDPNYTMLGAGKEAGIYYQNKTVEVQDVTSEIIFEPKHRALKNRLVVGLVTIKQKYREAPRQFYLVNVHMPYVGYTRTGRVDNACWLIEQLDRLRRTKKLPVVLCGDFNCNLHASNVKIPGGFMIKGNSGHNPVDAAGHFREDLITMEATHLDWGPEHFTEAEHRALGGKKKATSIINSYSLGGSHTPLCYNISRPISDDDASTSKLRLHIAEL